MRKKTCDVYILFNGRVTELISMNINFEFKILILNFEFNLRQILLYPYIRLLRNVVLP